MTTKIDSGDVHESQIDLVETLVHVDQDVVEVVRQQADDLRQVVAGDEFGRFRRRRSQQQLDPGLMLDQDLVD